MQIVTFGIYTCSVGAAFLVEFLNKELAALGAVGRRRLVITDKIADRIVGTSVEFLSASALTPPRDNLAVTIGSGTISERE